MLKGFLQAAVSLTAAAAVWGTAAHATNVKERFVDWEVEELVDKMDDTTRGIAIARSVGTPRAALLVKCDSVGDGMYVQVLGPYQGETGRDKTRPFVYRVDKQSKTEEQWRYVKDGAVQFDAEKARWFSRFIMNGKTLLVRQYSHQFETTDIEFPIAGAKQAMERVFAICKATF